MQTKQKKNVDELIQQAVNELEPFNNRDELIRFYMRLKSDMVNKYTAYYRGDCDADDVEEVELKLDAFVMSLAKFYLTHPTQDDRGDE